MPLAPPARNSGVIVKLKTGGGVEHVEAPEEASKTEHEFYIVCAALSVRAKRSRSCSFAKVLCVTPRSAWFYSCACCSFAQASVYQRHKGAVTASDLGSIWINTKPRMWWVTSRQAPGTLWVDQATPRAIFAFSQRDTSSYPNTTYLDHGDLVEDFRSAFTGKTLPKECIGKKGAGGDYYPTEEHMRETFEHVLAGVCT